MMVAGLQMNLAWEDPQENFRRAREMAGRAVAAGEGSLRLLVLPETFATGFSMNAQAMAAFASETRSFLAGLATDHGLHVMGGYAEPADPRPANACSIFAPGGEEILHYRKTHPFAMAGEADNYMAGESVETARVEDVSVTALICYDLRFPEPFRPAAPFTDLYCVIANWPSMRREAWTALLRARAIENQAYVLGVNRVGDGDGKPHTGDSALFDPMGVEVAAAIPNEPGMVLADVDPERVADVRKRLPFLTDRRPDLYQRLEAHRHE